ncbi:ROK family protein [Nocardia sp. NEAU-G5]|uniref:ROK family protein n=1 Tax=Nocardia albiluteola TaxID=2842303 RepID=A0ABS6BAM2_9NOCA|nr:ROK family protein [Nocardia albiluteola]MBU3066796.1 ROK family protein [Nocardia albiluteola]
MTVLALAIGPAELVAAQVAEDVDDEDIRRVPVTDRTSWETCRDLLYEVAQGANVASVGIGSVGPVDMAAGVVAPSGIAQWRAGFGIVDAARKAFPGAEVNLAVDGVCVAQAERAFGATRGVMDAVSLSVSGHIAGGVMMGGFVAVGRTGNAGHIGHLLVPGFDERCACGGHGCLEAVASGSAMLGWARAHGWGGTTLTELIAAADLGEEAAAAAAGRAGVALGRAIASVAALLDIDLVVLGGAVAECGPALWKPLGEAVAEHARLSYLPGLRVVPSPLGELGVLAGAGVLAMAGSSAGSQ